MRIRLSVLSLLALTLAAGCGTAEYNRRYEQQLKGLGDMLQPEQNRTPFATGSIRMPKFIDASVRPVNALPEELQLPFPTQYQFGYQKTLAGAKPQDIEVAFIESPALKGDVIDKALPTIMKANAAENPETVEKIELKGPDGKPLSMRYYRGAFKFLSVPDNANSPKIEKKIALYFYEQPGKTLAAIWIASAEADAMVHFFDGAKQSMATLVYDPNAKPKPGAAPARAGPALPPLRREFLGLVPAVPGAVPAVPGAAPAAVPANK